MSDGQYWNITVYYLVFAVINLALTYLLVIAWRHHVQTWPLQQGVRQALLLLLALFLLVFASLVLAFLFFATDEAWQAALNPDTPAPLFELFWIAGLPIFSLPAAIAGALQTFVRKEYEQLIP